MWKKVGELVFFVAVVCVIMAAGTYANYRLAERPPQPVSSCRR